MNELEVSEETEDGVKDAQEVHWAQYQPDKDELFYIYKTEIRKEAPIFIDVEVGEKSVQMELDTGASISVAGRKELKQALGTLPVLQKTTVKLKTFGGRVIEPLGVVQLGVRYGGQEKTLPVVVTSEPGPILMGRNWLRDLKLDWTGASWQKSSLYPSK